MLKKIKKLFVASYYRTFTRKWDMTRLLVAMARLRDGDDIKPTIKGKQCPVTGEVIKMGERTWKESVTKENNSLILWYNKSTTTKILYFPMELCK